MNQLAGNLTSQVRAIAEVSTAVAKGDLTRSITVEAQGEVAALKDNINQMIGNLKDTTRKNQEQDWLKTNLAQFSGMMQGQRSIESVAQLIMSELTPLVDAQHGAFYMIEADDGEPRLQLIASYGFGGRKTLSSSYRLKESLIGQCAFEKKRILLGDVPDDFIYIATGMGEATPRSVVVLPVLFEGEIKAVIELASFRQFSSNHLTFLDQLMASIGVILNMISSSMRTEELLQQLKTSNAELEAQATELNDKAELLEVKNREVELASRSLEEKAEQLQLISKYKSEFLANMSHELRTPLNSLLILSKMLADNRDGNLTLEQVKFAQTVFTSGNDLLQLINEILDLSKVEAGKMPIDPHTFSLAEVRDYLEQTFRHVAVQKDLTFEIRMARHLPEDDLQRHQPPAADPQEPALERLQVHRDGRGHAHRPARRPRARRERARLRGARHRHRDPDREAAAHLRGVPAGRRDHEPQVRRHRAGPDDQPRDRAPARRVDRGRQRARRREHLHARLAGPVRRSRGRA